jgi:Protein of unknown function (DUF2380)
MTARTIHRRPPLRSQRTVPNHPSQRRAALVGATLALIGARPVFGQVPLRTLAVVPLDLIDEHLNPATVQAQTRRLADAHAAFQRELAARGLYRVTDFAPARDLLETLRAQQEYMHRCPDCAVQLGRRLGTELVMVTWVQKVSELILNINVEIYEVAGERLLLSKSVDMRGNDDVSWERSVRYLVRDMAEKRERNPRYGQ